MRAVQYRVFEPAVIGGRPNPAHLSSQAYRAMAVRAATTTAARNDVNDIRVAFSGGGPAPTRVRVEVRDPVAAGVGVLLTGPVSAEAEFVELGVWAAGDGVGTYTGPLAVRQGKPMRPDVARAFDRMAAAARADGIQLIISSGFRTDAEQARLFAARPDPRWVARPGQSLHRLGTELDLGPSSAYSWLAAHARAFHFVQRYAWEPWHYGYVLNAGTSSVGAVGGGVPAYVPAQYVAPLRRAAARWSVSAALLAAQLREESGFNPRARSPSGALGIAQFMPGTARAYGLRDPFDPDASIDAQAHLMRDLLRQFGAVRLALAAYNAGPDAVRACVCVPANRETPAYVARILGLMGETDTAGGSLPVRLVK